MFLQISAARSLLSNLFETFFGLYFLLSKSVNKPLLLNSSAVAERRTLVSTFQHNQKDNFLGKPTFQKIKSPEIQLFRKSSLSGIKRKSTTEQNYEKHLKHHFMWGGGD